MFSLLHSQMNWKNARLKSTTSPPICCCTTLWKLNVQRYSYLWTKTATFWRSWFTSRMYHEQCTLFDYLLIFVSYLRHSLRHRFNWKLWSSQSGRDYHSASSTARSINGVTGWNVWSSNKEHIPNTASEHRCHYVWHWWPPNLPP